jgi:hypothetical protein
MARELWWASLNKQSPRYAEWLKILETDRVSLLSPWPAQAKLGDETTDVYALDWQDLDGEQSQRLLEVVAAKFGVETKEVEADLDRDGHFPIRAQDVTVFYDVRAFL